MRLIDADAALAAVKPYEPSDEMWSCTGGTAIRLIHNAIDNTPTVDAVQVVRCKDCYEFEKRGEYHSENSECPGLHLYGYCYHWDYEPGEYPNKVDGDDFCSHGEKKNERWKKES